MRFFIDESLSPQLALRLNDTGLHDAVHPLHVGRRGEPDHRVLERCIAEDRIIVTQNARDFRKLIGASDLHPGLILLPGVDREKSWILLQTVIAALKRQDELINRVAEIAADGRTALYPIP